MPLTKKATDIVPDIVAAATAPVESLALGYAKARQTNREKMLSNWAELKEKAKAKLVELKSRVG